LSFATDARTVRLRCAYPAVNRIWNMSDEGQCGLDLWVDGVYWRCFAPFGQAEAQYTLWDGLPETTRQVELWLSLYAPLQIIEFSLQPEGSHLQRWWPAYALDKPVVIYGTSITQGGCASRPSQAWPAVMARQLGVDHVNLGFSGAGKGEAEVAKCVAAVDACCYVLEWGINSVTWQELAERYGPFVDILRAAHPETPVLCVSPIYSSTEAFSPDPRLRLQREHIAALVADKRAAGDNGVYYLDGYTVLGPVNADGLADKTHINDYGFRLMGQRIGNAVRDLLDLGA
jgi:lysophospholipase L1-like esterase